MILTIDIQWSISLIGANAPTLFNETFHTCYVRELLPKQRLLIVCNHIISEMKITLPTPNTIVTVDIVWKSDVC